MNMNMGSPVQMMYPGQYPPQYPGQRIMYTQQGYPVIVPSQPMIMNQPPGGPPIRPMVRMPAQYPRQFMSPEGVPLVMVPGPGAPRPLLVPAPGGGPNGGMQQQALAEEKDALPNPLSQAAKPKRTVVIKDKSGNVVDLEGIRQQNAEKQEAERAAAAAAAAAKAAINVADTVAALINAEQSVPITEAEEPDLDRAFAEKPAEVVVKSAFSMAREEPLIQLNVERISLVDAQVVPEESATSAQESAVSSSTFVIEEDVEEWEVTAEKMDAGEMQLPAVLALPRPADEGRDGTDVTSSTGSSSSDPNRRKVFSKDDILKLKPAAIPERPKGFTAYEKLVYFEGGKPRQWQGPIGYLAYRLHQDANRGKRGPARPGEASREGQGDDGGPSWKRGEHSTMSRRGGGGGKNVVERKKLAPVDAMEQLSFQVMGILNKITPQTFEKLVVQLCDIPIQTNALLDKLVSMVFEKAISEPKFSNMYAEMCASLDSTSKFWPFVQIVHNQDENNYYLMTDVDFDKNLAGPFKNAAECKASIVDAETDDSLLPEMVERTFDVKIDSTFVFQELLVKIFINPANKEYFIGYSELTDVEPSKIDSGRYRTREEAENEAVKKYSFKRRLINQYVQKAFEESSTNTGPQMLELEEIKAKFVAEVATMTPDVRASKEQDIEERHSTIKKRTLGNIRFIGELYKMDMLKAPIMHACIQSTLRMKPKSKDRPKGEPSVFESILVDDSAIADFEQDLEMVCKLLLVVGEKFDNESVGEKKEMISSYFLRMTGLTKDKRLNSRIRFSIEEVLTLRKNDWHNRREQEGPLKLQEIHKKIEQEERKKEMQREQEQRRGGSRSGAGGGGGGLHRTLSSPAGGSRSVQSIGRSPVDSSGSSSLRKLNSVGPGVSNSDNSLTKGVPKILVNESRNKDRSNRDKGNSNSSNSSNISNKPVKKAKSEESIASSAEQEDVDDGDNTNANTSRIVEDISDSRLENRLKSILEEYLTLELVEEVEESLKDLPPRAIPALSVILMSKYLDCNKAATQEKIVQLINGIASALRSHGADILAALRQWEPMITMWDYVLECRKAPLYIGEVLRAFIGINALDKESIADMISDIRKEATEDEFGPPGDVFDATYSVVLTSLDDK